MDFSFIIPKLTRKYRQTFMDTSIEGLKKIVALKEQLIAIGYNLGEVNYMISTFSKGMDIAKIDSKQLRKVEDQLEAQLSIAKQCITFINGPK